MSAHTLYLCQHTALALLSSDRGSLCLFSKSAENFCAYRIFGLTPSEQYDPYKSQQSSCPSQEGNRAPAPKLPLKGGKPRAQV